MLALGDRWTTGSPVRPERKGSDVTIESVQAALGVLKAVAGNPGVGLSELARVSGVKKSRTYRILLTLEEEGFVVQSEDKGYQLGLQTMIIGQHARQGTGLVRAAEERIAELAEEFDENIQIRVRDGAENVQVFSRKSNQRLRVISSQTNRRPLGVGASGRLLLAHMAPEEIVTSGYKGKLLEESLRSQILAQGYSDSSGELTAGVEAVAVPIFSVEGRCTACLSASVPTARMSIPYKESLIEGLRGIAGSLVGNSY